MGAAGSVFGADAAQFRPQRVLPDRVPPHGLSFGGGIHTCIGRGLTVGATGRLSGQRRPRDAAGLLPQILLALYAWGLQPDPARPPRRATGTEQDYYDEYLVRFVDPHA